MKQIPRDRSNETVLPHLPRSDLPRRRYGISVRRLREQGQRRRKRADAGLSAASDPCVKRRFHQVAKSRD